jgi:hypothetical protein
MDRPLKRAAKHCLQPTSPRWGIIGHFSQVAQCWWDRLSTFQRAYTVCLECHAYDSAGHHGLPVVFIQSVVYGRFVFGGTEQCHGLNILKYPGPIIPIYANLVCPAMDFDS